MPASPDSCTRPPSATPSASPTPPRLFRSVADILALRPVLIRRGLHLRVESDDPGTKMMVTVLAAAEAAGKTLGRPATLDLDQAAKEVEAFGEGTAVKALARQHQVGPKTIRRVLDAAGARKLPEQLDVIPDLATEQQPEPNPEITLDLPGLLASHLLVGGDESVRRAVAAGRTNRRGTGYSIRLTAPLERHRAALQQSAALAAESAEPTARKAHRVYAARISAAE
ncbi:hypothetical protein [Streptomyces sp. NPDC048295]|uniref:hypothetical protein n=1 Tax=Streptomyces sp. NPDC048295 TaxID=3154617 RepID=UPI003443018B